MRGDNCSIYGCGSCRWHKDIGIFKFPTEAVDKEWRDLWLAEIKTIRIADEKFQEQIEKKQCIHMQKTL